MRRDGVAVRAHYSWIRGQVKTLENDISIIPIGIALGRSSQVDPLPFFPRHGQSLKDFLGVDSVKKVW